MKRFLAFHGRDNHPIGGINDFIGDFDTELGAINACFNKIEEPAFEWAHVYDTELKEKVWEKE